MVYMTNKEIDKKEDEASKYKHICKCGHTVVIYPFEKRIKKLCGWCGRYVYINKKEEFRDRLNFRRNER